MFRGISHSPSTTITFSSSSLLFALSVLYMSYSSFYSFLTTCISFKARLFFKVVMICSHLFSLLANR